MNAKNHLKKKNSISKIVLTVCEHLRKYFFFTSFSNNFKILIFKQQILDAEKKKMIKNYRRQKFF